MKFNYYTIPILDNQELLDVVFSRAQKLGWKQNARKQDCLGAVCLWIDDNSICYLGIDDALEVLKGITFDGSTKLVNLYDFFHTDKYKVKVPVHVELNDEYDAIVTDTIKVGCQEFSGQKLEELYKAYKEYNSK